MHDEGHSAPASIYIYRLANPDLIASRAEEIGRVLFGSDGMGSETYFRVSSLTGEITYWDRGAIWKNTAPDDVPRNADTAERIARAFLEKSERKIAQSALGRGRDRLPRLFPSHLKAAGSQLMFLPDTEEDESGPLVPDHWVCTLQAYLPTGGLLEPSATGKPASAAQPPWIPGAEPDAPVNNGIVDVRVGASGRIVGLISRWRPAESYELVPRLPPPEKQSHTKGAEQGSESEPLLYYWLAGEDVPQSILAPFCIVKSEEGDRHSDIFPASNYSLMVGILERRSAEGAILQAVAAGTSGNLEYQWGTLRFHEESEFELLGSSASVSVPPGVHNVVLDVFDRGTGAFVRTQRIVVTMPEEA